MVRELPLSQGKVALVDDEDFDAVSAFKWYAQRGGLRTEKWYAYSKRGRKVVYLHAFLMGTRPGFTVDHEDNDGLNCRRSNMRFATKAEQQHNRRKTPGKTSQYIGVSHNPRRSRRNPWVVYVQCGTVVRTGAFATEVEAARARDDFALELHGDFAKLNFPQEHAA